MVGTRRTHGQPRRPRNVKAPRSARLSGNSQASAMHPSWLGHVNKPGRVFEHHIPEDRPTNVDNEENEFLILHMAEFEGFCLQRRQKGGAKDPLPSSATTHQQKSPKDQEDSQSLGKAQNPNKRGMRPLDSREILKLTAPPKRPTSRSSWTK